MTKLAFADSEYRRQKAQAITVAILAWGIATAMLVAGAKIISGESAVPYWQWLIVVAVSLDVALVIGVITAYWLRTYFPSYPVREPRFAVLRREVNYRITAAGLLEYSRVLTVRALEDGLDSFVDRYYWTGQLASAPLAGRNVDHISLPPNELGMYDFYRAHFDTPLRKGDTLQFEVRWPAMADWRQARPYVSVSTEEPTYSIVLNVSIPRDKRTTDGILQETCRAAESLLPLAERVAAFDAQGEFRWEIRRPAQYHHYRLRWAWEGTPAKADMVAVH